MPDPYIYPDLNEVPAPWRTLQGGRLSLDEVNGIIADAYAWGSLDDHGAFVPDLGGARVRFISAHVLVDGLWARKGGE